MSWQLPLLLGPLLTAATADETIWIEAEHLHGVRGSCFPDMGGKTEGHWALSGPGIAPEWTQGGESEWLSIACAGNDDRATATAEVEIPEAGRWTLWVRYRDWRRETEQFAVRIEQPGRPPQQVVFGNHSVVDEEEELKLLWNWAFGWDAKSFDVVKGPATITLLAHSRQKSHRQIDCLCLTTDASYRPRHREKPVHPTWRLLDEFRNRSNVGPKPLAARSGEFTVPAAWKLPTFRGKSFLYLWNVSKPWEDDLASTDPKRVLVPYHTEAVQVAAFRAAYGGKADVPIFSDPRIVPAFHGGGPNILDNPHFVKWLEANPDRAWANMMNYIDPKPLLPSAKANWARFQDRYVGNISGESLGHNVPYDAKALAVRMKAAKSRDEAAAAYAEIFRAGVVEKQKIVFGAAGENPYRHFIPCQSSDMSAFAHLAREWGARTVGFENTANTPALGMRLAFVRGGARQYGGLWATYRSCNFGDSSTIFSEQSTYAHPKHVYDNWYDVWSGAGLTWYKFDLWHQYLSGSSMFYHEQGFDEFWTPGGGSTPRKPIQLSPKGRLVEHFLATTRKHPDRGTPFTPIAFLLDRSHGWDPNSFQPSYFGVEGSDNPIVLRFNRHARMLKEWFRVAYHPYGPKEAEINNGLNQNYLPGPFGDLFDVLVTSPTRRDALSAYPVVIANGEINVSAEWGRTLSEYVEKGGTLIVSDAQLSGPGVAALKIPECGATQEDDMVQWLPSARRIDSQRFRFRAIRGGVPLATAQNGDALAATFERGKGRLVFLSIPKGLGIDDAATPVVALLLAHTRQGLLPVEVSGEVEWLVNRTEKGWLVGLFNPAGNTRLQHGVGPTDYRQERHVAIRTMKRPLTRLEWFTESEPALAGSEGEWRINVTVPAGGVRIVEWEEK